LEHALCGVQDLLRRVSFTRAGSRVGGRSHLATLGQPCRRAGRRCGPREPR
jgi:hypothetical protein